MTSCTPNETIQQTIRPAGHSWACKSYAWAQDAGSHLWSQNTFHIHQPLLRVTVQTWPIDTKGSGKSSSNRNWNKKSPKLSTRFGCSASNSHLALMTSLLLPDFQCKMATGLSSFPPLLHFLSDIITHILVIMYFFTKTQNWNWGKQNACDQENRSTTVFDALAYPKVFFPVYLWQGMWLSPMIPYVTAILTHSH